MQFSGSKKFEVRWQIPESVIEVFLDGLAKERAKCDVTLGPHAIPRATMKSKFKTWQPCPPEFCEAFSVNETRFKISI